MTVRRRRLALVSLHAHRPLAPRGERTRRVAERLKEDWEVELVAPPPTVSTGGASGSGGSSPLRRFGADVVDWVMLDKWEPWSVQRLMRWTPEVDGALLIGHPYSPLVHASARLSRAGIPYVVDVGDPWVLTNPTPFCRGLALRRARHGERRLWQDAAGAVLTTRQQADQLTELFPSLVSLVRPNGFEAMQARSGQAPSRDGSELRLAHFGMLSSQRLDLRPFLCALRDSGHWERISFTQFGDDFSGVLDQMPVGVEVERQAAYPWQEVIELAAGFDAALVVGNLNAGQLPSKAVQYLTLPIPRIAVVERRDDALAEYVEGRPGWLVVSSADADAAEALAGHLAQPWTEADLRPPESESWAGVATEIAAFVERRLGASAPARVSS